MRLSSRKAARGSSVSQNCTGNPGPSWAILSRPCGTDRDTSGSGLFSSAVQISRSRKAHLDKTVSVYTHCETDEPSGIPANGNRGNPDSNYQINDPLQRVN